MLANVLPLYMQYNTNVHGGFLSPTIIIIPNDGKEF